LIQVMLVGFAIGMTRTVVPALAESEFGLEPGSFLLLTSFVVAFGAEWLAARGLPRSRTGASHSIRPENSTRTGAET
jgi:hypothetical protein